MHHVEHTLYALYATCALYVLAEGEPLRGAYPPLLFFLPGRLQPLLMQMCMRHSWLFRVMHYMHSLLSLHYMHYGQVCRFAGSTHTGYLGLCMRGRQGSRKGGRGKYTSRACLLGEELEDRLVQDFPVFSLTRSSSDLSQFPACDRGCRLLLFCCSRETAKQPQKHLV